MDARTGVREEALGSEILEEAKPLECAERRAGDADAGTVYAPAGIALHEVHPPIELTHANGEGRSSTRAASGFLKGCAGHRFVSRGTWSFSRLGRPDAWS